MENEIEFAREMIADIRHDLSNYEACGMWDDHAQQSQELGWWKRRLSQLEAA